MNFTTLIYSSHNRSNYIHNDWIVQRALRGNGRIMFLPMSEQAVDGNEYARQEYSWNNFKWFFDCYDQFGLSAHPFYWTSSLRREDADILMRQLTESDVVILGGGDPAAGMWRYREIGRRFYHDANAFEIALHNRQVNGQLTAGFSAGADQMGQFMCSAVGDPGQDIRGFALCRNIMSITHYDDSRRDWLYSLARQFGQCMVFGFPNDSGLATACGNTPEGRIWQLMHFIIDTSWTYPSDAHHIKTRQGFKIQHFYPDGRHWAFGGGEAILRIQSPDNSRTEAFILYPNGHLLDYWTQQPAYTQNPEQIICER